MKASTLPEIAAIPLGKPIAPSVPSSAAIFSSNRVTVGLVVREYTLRLLRPA